MKNVKLFSILTIILLAVSCKNKDVNPNLPVANFTADNDTIPYGIGSNLVFNFTNTSSEPISILLKMDVFYLKQYDSIFVGYQLKFFFDDYGFSYYRRI